jgi:hypothetical protein
LLLFFFGKEVLPYDFHAQVSHPCTESRLVQVRIFGTDAMKPFRVIVQPDEFPCQFLILLFGDIFPDADQKKRQGLQAVSDVPANLLAICFVTAGRFVVKRFRKFQALTDYVGQLEQVANNVKP